jgi:hypothetical protein
MLRLVHPPIGGKEPVHSPKGRRSPALRLTDVEAMRLRAALRNLRALYGTWSCLAEAMGGLNPESLQNIAGGRKHPSPAIALAAARAAGSSIDALLRAPADASVCPTCGQKRGGSA